MKKWWFIWILLLCRHSFSQNACLPLYDLPVQKIQLSNNINIAYVRAGKGKPIIFIHGLGGNLSHWSKNINELSSDYNVIAIDLPGYGHSIQTFNPGEDLLQFYADRIAEFIKKKKLRKVTLAGHSMGGQIAIITALSHRKQIKKLILLAPAGLETFTEIEAQILINATKPEVFKAQTETVIRDNYKRNFYQLPVDAEKLIQDRLRLIDCPEFNIYTQTVSNGVKGMLHHPVKNKLNQIKQPVLIVFGENDALIPNTFLHPTLTRQQLLDDANKIIKRKKIVQIKEAGHLLQYEKWQEVNNSIKQFLN
jgi:pimeloyl-ACP methyl ester carboxylesterase